MKLKKRRTQDIQPQASEASPCAMTNGGEWESREDLSVLLASIADAVIKSRDGVIVWCNDRVEEVFGYSKEELLGTDGSKVYPRVAEYPRRGRWARNATEERGYFRGRTEVTRKDGTTGFVEFSISRIPGREPPEYVTVAADVTRRVLAQQALRQANDELERRVAERTSELERANEELRRSEERFRALIENSSDGITVLDAEGRLKYESPTVSLITGYERGERLGHNSFELVYPDDMPKVSDALRRLLRHPGGTERLDVRILHKDGTWRTLEVVARNLLDDPAAGGIVVNQRDITERKRGEERLTALYAALNASADGVIIIDADGNVKDVNESVFRGQGYTGKDEMVGRMALDFIVPEDRDRVMASVAQMAANGHVEDVEYSVITRDGEPVSVESNGLALRGEGGELLGYVIIARDVRERKKAIEALRASEEKYRAVVENANEAIVVAQDGMLKFFNSKTLEITGFDQGELDSKPFVELIHPDDRQMVVERHQKRLQGERLPSVYSFRVVGKTGKVVWMEINAISFTWEGKPATLNFLSDITQRKEAEEALRASEERYRKLLENMQDVVYSIDTEFRVADVSPSVKRLLGYEPEELMGRPFPDLNVLAPESLEKAVSETVRALAGERFAATEYVFIAKDGTRKIGEVSSAPLVSGDGKISATVAVGRDITERRRMEQALRESEESLRALIENAPEAITAYDLAGIVIDCNRRGEEMLGYSREELVGRSMFEIGAIPDDYVPRASRALGKGKWDRNTRPFEFDLLRKDGSRITVEATTITVERGGKAEIICIARDVTERKHMEQQLQLAGRLAAVGELAAGVAHELNNPLAAVQGFAQYLAEREGVDEATRGDLNTIFKEAQRATKITGNLLSFARKHAPEKSFLSINDVVERSLELHSYRMRVNNVEVVKELEPDLPKTMADFHQMQQVFVNVATNAEQAMMQEHGGGRLIVKTEQAGEMIRVSFTDDGPGMSGEVLKSVFDPFFTTKEVGKGTGLGLSICYGIVQEHGGRLHAESEPGRGATFVVEIPVVPEHAQARAEADPSGRQRPAP